MLSLVYRTVRGWARLAVKCSNSALFRLSSVILWTASFLVMMYLFLPQRFRVINTEGYFSDFYQADLANIPKHPFDPGQPKMVVLLGYQRVGSTFTGQVFNQNPEALYMFEPVDGVFSAMYGIDQGWTIPTDIAYHWNGSERTIPSAERNAVANALGNILTCDTDSIPTEVFAHTFHNMFKRQETSLGKFTSCIGGSYKYIGKCRSFIAKYCPHRFGGMPSRQDKCREYLWDRKSLQDSELAFTEKVVAFQKYRGCVRKIRSHIDNCIDMYKETCKEAQLRTMKTVRLDMATADLMLTVQPNLRIIHLIRDPRAVVLSRLQTSSFHGKYSGRDIVKEAKMYCNVVNQDILTRQYIEKMYPGRTMQVIYEQFVTHPFESVQAIYSFLDSPVPAQVLQWLRTNTEDVKNSTRISKKWQQKVSYKDAIDVNEVCKELFENVKYQWP